MEAAQPAPDGLRVEGYEANVAFWHALVADPHGSFEVEDVVVAGDRAINRWRCRNGTGDGSSVRGVTLIRVRDGRIAQAVAGRTDRGGVRLRQRRMSASDSRNLDRAFIVHGPSSSPR